MLAEEIAKAVLRHSGMIRCFGSSVGRSGTKRSPSRTLQNRAPQISPIRLGAGHTNLDREPALFHLLSVPDHFSKPSALC